MTSRREHLLQGRLNPVAHKSIRGTSNAVKPTVDRVWKETSEVYRVQEAHRILCDLTLCCVPLCIPEDFRSLADGLFQYSPSERVLCPSVRNLATPWAKDRKAWTETEKQGPPNGVGLLPGVDVLAVTRLPGDCQILGTRAEGRDLAISGERTTRREAIANGCLVGMPSPTAVYPMAREMS